MTVKMIVTDMDGTFLNNHHAFNKNLFAYAFALMRARGIKFVLASGSSFPRLRRDFYEYQDHLAFISQNGSVTHIGNRLIDYIPLTPHDLNSLLLVLHRTSLTDYIDQLVVSGVHGSYVDASMSEQDYNRMKIFYEKITRVPSLLNVFQTFPDEIFTKITICFSHDLSLNDIHAKLDNHLPANLLMENSGYNCELIGNALATKRNAIETLQTIYRIDDPNDIVTFGDNENDLGMLAMTKNSFAMRNAADHIKLQAHHTTQLDNNDDGVLETIMNILDMKLPLQMAQ